ncbi:hypothetical protein VSR01_10810 [Actinacidiphila sp. DG2A-62]|uniref:hypothetical protein n=1 Tax=Actinacidiphila sp. DG2A-62 TaxID=3108821 RepID=UPI002DB80F68|nr:hypothetical protein [Actinacidiphila sp. DG2A-62]MEC3994009.1 hypothetical protein [Actinacidiphila sp. DG2A-62]
MDATTIGSVLGFAGVLAAAVVAFLGKRGETAVAGSNQLIDQLQEERADQREQIRDLRQQIADRDARIAELASYRTADQAEITRLRNIVQSLGGQP